MGGPGSGNHYHWWRPSKKTVVEDCLDIDAFRWTRKGILRAGVHQAGSCRWVYQSGRECSVNYDVLTLDMTCPLLQLSYSRSAEGQQETLDYAVDLTTTEPPFGGLRWWFVCPLTVNGRPCNRRVGKLYLPPGARYFGCRHCHRLTYTSSQEHDKRVDFFRRHPELIEVMLAGPHSITMAGLAMKAIMAILSRQRKWEQRMMETTDLDQHSR
jgi:hypothetical protein